jgi:hypothetical protein
VTLCRVACARGRDAPPPVDRDERGLGRAQTGRAEAGDAYVFACQDRLVTTTPGETPSPAGSPAYPGLVRRWVRARPADITDLFVYVVVLNLAIEYVPSIISEGFTLSLLTAVLLKIALEVVIHFKSTILHRLRMATTPRAKISAGILLWVVAAGSKLVVLELVDLVFGDAVSLGGFVPVTLLVMTLLLSRAGVRRLLYDTRPND